MLIYCFISPLIAYITYVLTKKPSISPTRASSSVTLIAILFLYILSNYYSFNFNKYSVLVFGASFVGMCSYKVVSPLGVILGAVIFAVVFSYITGTISSLGGALGFSAFVSIMLSQAVFKLLKK